MKTMSSTPPSPGSPAAALAQSAFRIRQSALPSTGDPEFKPLEKEIKIHWLK